MENSRYRGFKYFFIISSFIFLILIIYGVTAKDIMAEGSHMLEVYWGVFTFIDIYFLFFIFYFWIVYREKSILMSILWFPLIMGGGSLTIALYCFIAMATSKGDMKKVLLGKRI
jgi:energy-coupling factor transporter transmembrane protein EcfT